MAVKKMENKDFLRARKIAIQAQKLYPELEKVAQLIMVCDVHCSAENKVRGTEMDWYGILKVKPTADDLLIRKQSREFGLLLHPDKNKLPGAADAFKLIGEAQSVLLDQRKRWIYDMKCVSGGNRPPNVTPPGHEISSLDANKQFQQALQTGQTGYDGSRPAFWAACPFCFKRYQCCGDMLSISIRCQTCGKSCIGNDISTTDVALHESWSLLPVLKQTGAHNQAAAKVDRQINAENIKLKLGENTVSSYMPQGSKPNERCGNVSTNCNQKRKAEIPGPCGKMNETKRKQVSEPNRSCNGSRQTFWTACSFCSTRYEYYRNVLNLNLLCRNCQRAFTAYEITYSHISSAD
ncbi:hypothetical protein AgCh_029170 [Apium graveolens]